MYKNNNNTNDDFAWMSNGLSTNNNNSKNRNTKKSNRNNKAPSKSLNSMRTNTYTNAPSKEYTYGIPKSKSMRPAPRKKQTPTTNTTPNEFLTGVPTSKSGYNPGPIPQSVLQQQYQNFELLTGSGPKTNATPNEFLTGVPMSKSGYIPSKPKIPKWVQQQRQQQQQKQDEFSSGIPFQKSGPPSSPGSYNWSINEFNSGVPPQKVAFTIPPQPTTPPKGSIHTKPKKSSNPARNNITMNTLTKNKSAPTSLPSTNAIDINPMEFNSGIPMSKSGYIPTSSFNTMNTNNKNTITTKRDSIEFDSGVPPSKFMDPKNNSNVIDFNDLFTNEFNSGVPISKSGGGGYDFAGFGAINKPVFYDNNLNIKAQQREYQRGVPMSKSGMRFPPQYTNTDPLIVDGNETPSIEAEDYPGYDTVIAIDDILKRDSKALMNLRMCLEARGWCKIRYPERINKVIKSVMDNVYKWFNETPQDEKLKYSRKLSDGKPNQQSEYSYNRIPGFKEGLRILTGDIYKIHYDNNKYPDSVKDDILKINKEFDGLSLKLMKCVVDKVYLLSDYKQFGNQYDISMLNDGQVLKLKYSMLDFVNYYNDKEYIDKIRADESKNNDENNPKPNVLKSEFNVFPHSDPGLFALSFASTNEGLEMYDYVTEKWIPIGLNEGIWWNGKTANVIDSRLKSGEHRVKIDNKTFKPRFTGWYEVSCNKQLKPEVMKEALDMMKNGVSGDVNKMAGNILAGLDLAINASADPIKKSKSAGDNADSFHFNVPDLNNKKESANISSMNNMSKNNTNITMNTNLFGNVTPPPSKEYNFGVPMSKSMPMNNNFTMNEYGSGVPMTKMWAPINVKIPINSIPSTPPSNDNNNTKKKSKKRGNEYNYGVPMSKSGF